MEAKRITTMRVLTLIFLLSLAIVAQADSTYVGWKKSLAIDITTTQTAYSRAWVGGEAGSFNWTSNLNGSAEKQMSPRTNLRTTLKTSFGQTMIQDEESRTWSKPKKSTDLIDWETMLRFTFQNAVVDPYIAFRFESQFYTPLSDLAGNTTKAYLSPTKMTESAGIARKLHEKDKDLVITRLGLAIQQIRRKSADLTAPGNEVKIVTTSSSYSGIESVSDTKLTLSKRLQYTGKLTLYKAFAFSEKEAAGNDNWKAVDVGWENIIAASVSKIITVNVYTQLLYDKEIVDRGRFKETLAIGFVFKMI
jgi:hypothetical protein